MAKIPQNIIDKILETAKIEEVVGDFLELRKTGIRYTAICPFHDDRHDGNFIVYPKGNCYKCFVCEAKGGAVDFLMNYEKLSYPDAIRWLGKKYHIETDNIPFDYVPPPPKPRPAPLPTLVLPRRLVVERSGNTIGDPLCEWIRSLPWDYEQRVRVDTVLYEYCVGHAIVEQPYQRHEFTVFWQIDRDGNPRTAHYMKYKPTGKRMHKEDDRYNTDWMHSLLERNGITTIYDPKREEARQCLFGEHLMNRYPNAPVCLVESEKTALLMAIAYGNHPLQLWMACCGASNITSERLKPLIDQRRKIVLYPDRDGIDMWMAKAENLHYDRVVVDTEPVTKWWKPIDGEKADIADVVIRELCERQKLKTMNQVKAAMPQAGELIDKLNLTIENNE